MPGARVGKTRLVNGDFFYLTTSVPELASDGGSRRVRASLALPAPSSAGASALALLPGVSLSALPTGRGLGHQRKATA